MAAHDDYAQTAQFYDDFGPYKTRHDVAFFVELAQESGGPVLEAGCGTGRVLIPAAQAGIPITGIDLSPDMLSVARERLASEAQGVRERVTLLEADMRDFDLAQHFRLITLPFRSFQHLQSVRDQLACLNTLYNHLEPGGLLVLDVFNPSLPLLSQPATGEEFDDGEPFTLKDGRKVQRRARIPARDVSKQVQQVELIYYVTHPDGTDERLAHSFQMRWFYRYEVEHLLSRVGFVLQAVYSDYDRTPFGDTYPGEIIALARRPDQQNLGDGLEGF